MLLFPAILVVWLIGWARQRVDLTAAFSLAWPVVLAMGLLAVWLVVQICLPEPHGSWDFHATLVQLHKTLLYLVIFLLALLVIRTRQELELLCWAIVVAGCLQVMMRIVLEVPGSYVNRNHFAGYLEMSIALAIGLMIARLDSPGYRLGRAKLRGWVITLLSRKVLIRVLIVVLVIGLILSRSRMGNTAFFVSLMVAASFSLLAFRRVNHRIMLFLVSVLVIDVLAMGAFFGIEQLQQRFEELNVEQDGRAFQFEVGLRALQENWLTGVGAGAYYTAAAAWRDERINMFYEHADNDLLQLTVELGLPGAGLMLLMVAVVLVQAFRVQMIRRDPFMKAMGFGSMMGVVSLLIHSSTDFNLQLVSNAGTFVVLLALPFLALTIDRRGSPWR